MRSGVRNIAPTKNVVIFWDRCQNILKMASLDKYDIQLSGQTLPIDSRQLRAELITNNNTWVDFPVQLEWLDHEQTLLLVKVHGPCPTKAIPPNS